MFLALSSWVCLPHGRPGNPPGAALGVNSSQINPDCSYPRGAGRRPRLFTSLYIQTQNRRRPPGR